MVSKTVGNCAPLIAGRAGDRTEVVQDHEPTLAATDEADITTPHQPLATLVDTNIFTFLPGTSAPESTTFEKTIGDDCDVLIGAAVNGDRAAIEGVLRWIRPLVVRYCRAHLGGQDKTLISADDVAQEVCLAVLTALPRYRDQGRPFLAFVYGIAVHKVADAHRSAARNRAEPVPELPDSQDLADGPEAQALQVEMARRMATLLNILPVKQREILRLRIVVGLSTEEIAQAIGSTPGAVRVAQHRALNRLRAILTATPQILSRGAQARPDHRRDRHEALR
ncbi:MAG: sigma-70 family RNA polymerase sigma factor [Pseudonocardiales bacterium]|nr:sigma-70 family RNA polymerase sigma factor [Pseudonocardiales bacterium]